MDYSGIRGVGISIRNSGKRFGVQGSSQQIACSRNKSRGRFSAAVTVCNTSAKTAEARLAEGWKPAVSEVTVHFLPKESWGHQTEYPDQLSKDRNALTDGSMCVYFP